MSDTISATERIPAAAWRMLALGVAAQAAGTLLLCTPAYLIPLLHVTRGMPLTEAGLFAAAPNFGMVLTLVIWGALADRYGERRIIAGGLGLTALFAFAAATAHGLVSLGILLVMSGAAAASTNAASGRVVVGWFPRPRRGLAMGIRQMSQPLGVAVAALVVPSLAEHHGIGAPLALAGVATAALALACAIGVVNPPRPVTPSTSSSVVVNPYSQNRFLVRIHLVSVLLVVPQFTLSIFGLIWLISALHWGTTQAGAVIAAAQFVGAIGRVVVGVVSDRVGSRVRVLRWVAVSGVVVMILLALSGSAQWGAGAAIFLVVATTVSVADNGLAFTSVAEAAGPAWAGKALGIQNTGQFVAASAVGPTVGALIAAVGYPLTFAVVAMAPLAAIGLVPRRDQHSAQE
jgi:MFS family permease